MYALLDGEFVIRLDYAILLSWLPSSFFAHFRYCLHGDLVTPCPEGHYCPDGTGNNWQQCPPGTYNNETGLQAISDCKQCPGGFYCQDHGLDEPSGQCDPGYYCEYGVDRARPTGNNATYVNGSCVASGKLPVHLIFALYPHDTTLSYSSNRWSNRRRVNLSTGQLLPQRIHSASALLGRILQ